MDWTVAMQVMETLSDGLKRELKVVVGADELGQRFTDRLDEMKDRVQLKGFRKGKVPVAHLRKMFGKAVMAEVLEATVKETSAKAIEERNEKPASSPKIALTEDQDEIARIIDGKADLAYSMQFEVLPKFDVTDLTQLELERLVTPVSDAEVDEALSNLRTNNVVYKDENGRAAQSGDQVRIDFVGKIDGVPFDGGSAEGVELVLGRGQFIPGFEEQLTGATAGEERVITVTFPAEYGATHLAGKDATFDIKVHAVAAPAVPEADDAFAESLGLDSIDKLKAALKERIGQEFAQASRLKIKRDLLDALDASHSFELPASLVDREFDQIWAQLTRGLEQSGKTFEDEGKSEAETREEYRRIAGRRVRLGLVIGDIGDKNKIEVTQDELRRALVEQVRRFPGQEKMVYEYFEKTPGAVAELRAPIFEEKVVDFILANAKVSEREVSKDDLMKAAQGAEEA
ncbi:MAG: trigger factor [Hyphomicrobiaceae bacterium]|nr:trigger factor [Hyphomicrobiaceae bacterium]